MKSFIVKIAHLLRLSVVLSFVYGLTPSKEPLDPSVLIIDDGFWMEDPRLKNRIAASYTLSCQHPQSNLTSYTAFRQSKLRNLSSRFCQLEEGVISEFEEDGSLGHGAAVARVVAHDTHTKLVLIHRKLAEPESISTPCEVIKEIAWTKSLLQDQEFRKQLLARGDLEFNLLAAMAAKHNARMVNLSFGYSPYQVLVDSLSEGKCKFDSNKLRSDLRIIDQESFKLSQQHSNRAKTWVNNYSLVVQSAGNMGLNISEDNSSDCYKQGAKIVVGALNPHNDKRSPFSNYGTCVDIYAPGEDIIIDSDEEGDALFHGTSAAAPFLVNFTLRSCKYNNQTDSTKLKACLAAFHKDNHLVRYDVALDLISEEE